MRCDEWSSGPLRVAVGRRARRVGLRPVPGRVGLLLRARSIHTFGMRVPIIAVAVDRSGVVIASRVLPPRRVWTVWPAAAIIETAVGAGLPVPGARLEVWAHGTEHAGGRAHRGKLDR